MKTKISLIAFLTLFVSGCVDEYKFNAKVAELDSTANALKEERRNYKLCKYELDQMKEDRNSLQSKVFELTKPKREQLDKPASRNKIVKYSLDLTIQVDGRPEINSTHELIDGPQPVLLPNSLWECMLRQTVTDSNVKEFIGTPVEGKTFYNKELMCVIRNERTKEVITQVGTGTACVQDQVSYESNFMYIREGNRIFKFQLTCSF